MSIRILPKEEIGKNEPAKKGICHIPPVLFPDLNNLYQSRAERFQSLATAENPFSEYLIFASHVTRAQQNALYDNPLMMDITDILQQSMIANKPPLDCKTFIRTDHWYKLFNSLIAELAPMVPEEVKPALENLTKVSIHEFELMVTALLNGEFSQVPPEQALFIWAALSWFWTQLASQIPGKATAEYGEHRQFCPVCGSIPVSSVVQIGINQGLRYLHCNLCETEWHVVRVKCSNCEQIKELDYWCLASEYAAVKAESCGDCGSYLKILYQERDAKVDAVADDLASLILDAKLEEEGFARSSINPFLFPCE
uniref:Protein FdhE homolog n=1 Tax=Arsenophonus endosymbiont of Trialeurodes vaporariorum TaxID=235567 RepID=A0A3B0M0K3_9GAMM